MKMRIILSICLLLSLCACTSGFPLAFSPVPEDQRLFLQGIRNWEPGQELPEAFSRLERTYPESVWTAKLHTLTSLSDLEQSRKATIDRLRKEINTCRQEGLALQKEKGSLEDDMEKLKRLLIDLEKRRVRR